MIVVDTNVLAYLYLPSAYSKSAERVLEQDPDWVAPILWRGEFRNVLAVQMRRKPISFQHAQNLQKEAESLLAGGEYEIDSPTVLELVRDSDCSAYDCEFIALAIKLQTRVVTAGKQLLRAFPRCAISLTAN